MSSYEEGEWISDEKARKLLKQVLSRERIHYCFAFHEGKAGRFPPFTFSVKIDDGKGEWSIRRNFANPVKVERSPDSLILVAKRKKRGKNDYFPDEVALLVVEDC